ncbi:MAG: type I restriction enzyme HsdR N-terminal domain-containing protein [Muribaculaceae bacterium]|nr:type I restriction enzyme HsdR N-terminal domain-containing protein [Muribaculaceae bacterium]
MEGKILKVFDPLRGKYVALTPEEYVRQHFTAWMTGYLGYPASLMNNEVSLTLNDTRRRCDTVVFRKDGSPSVIVEYKAPTVAITQKVFDQIARYNMVLHSRYLIVSNGLRHFCCRMDYDEDTYSFLPQIPVWSPEI